MKKTTTSESESIKKTVEDSRRMLSINEIKTIEELHFQYLFLAKASRSVVFEKEGSKMSNPFETVQVLEETD